MSLPILKLLDYVEKALADLDNAIKKRSLRKTKTAFEKLTGFSDCLKESLPEDFTKENLGDFERHIHFIEVFLKKKDFGWIKSNFDDIIKKDFPNIKSKIHMFVVNQKAPGKRVVPLSNKVFIVHGRNHEPMKELKKMLKDFGLKPIVLHEQPSASRTIVEKLEKYSDVGYSFVILTPDDRGGTHKGKVPILGGHTLENSYFRARQNVILELGYFIGLLGRDKVCCLYKGDIDLPSDIHGIIYIPFKESVNEVRDKIVKELKAAGYKIRR